MGKGKEEAGRREEKGEKWRGEVVKGGMRDTEESGRW